MTLQELPPPNINYFEFNQDIESGLRPPLFTRDVSTSVEYHEGKYLPQEFHSHNIVTIYAHILYSRRNDLSGTTNLISSITSYKHGFIFYKLKFLWSSLNPL